MKAITTGFIASLALCCVGFCKPAAASAVLDYNYYFNYSDSIGDSANLDIETASPVTASGVPVVSIFGVGDFQPAFGAEYSFSLIFGPDSCCGADNVLYSAPPYVDSSGIAFDVYPLVELALDPAITVTSDSDSGTLTATPLPAALPLFATGLGGLGLFGWRRKRNNGAAIAAA
jgi:hypothetical protein